VTVLGEDGFSPTGKLTVRAKKFILAAGALGSPGILLRSGLGGDAVGKRTFLHPVVGITSLHRDPIEGYYGAPQSVASHHFASRGDRVGFFLEAAPIHPMLAALSLPNFGVEHRQLIEKLPRLSAHIALAIDGFSPGETGGTVRVRPSGAPILDYELGPGIYEAMREGARQLVRIDLAAGAQAVYTGHDPGLVFRSEADLAQLDAAPFAAGKVSMFSAHVMGGCALGDDPKRAVVRSEDLRHHQLSNLHVIDGSVFPTSLGVNPQESIYGLAHFFAERLS
jgi:hypothetical protein